MTGRIGAVTTITIVLALASLALAQEDTSSPGAEGTTRAAAASEGALEVAEIILGNALENGVPPSPTTAFSRADAAVYCVVRLHNTTRAEGAIRVAFERAEGEPQARAGGVRLEYPARATYRTVARTSTQRDPGSYRCVVRTEEGQVLSHADFTLSE